MRRPSPVASLLGSCLLIAACGTGSSPVPSVPPSAAPATTASPSTGASNPSGAPSTTAPPAATSPTTTASASPIVSGRDFVVGGDRPVVVQVPEGYDPATPAPLLIRLHGYGDGPEASEGYLGLGALADREGMLYAAPAGTLDGRGRRFWNATDACCDFGGAGVDDSAYLASVIAEIAAEASVDPARVYLFGHSNGGFMSYRMAFDHADTVAAMISLAGATFDSPADCRPSSPVAILQIHGTDDLAVRYEGGNLGSFIPGAGLDEYPGARETVETWAAYDGCEVKAAVPGERLDLDAGLAGRDGPAETTVAVYGEGCRPGGHAELWTIAGGGHVPEPTDRFAEAIVGFLLAHPKP